MSELTLGISRSGAFICCSRAPTKRSSGSKRRAAPLPAVHAYLASAYALKDETERAAAELAEARNLADNRYSNLARLRAVGYWGVPKVRALFEATYCLGLRKAGMPEK